MSVAVARRAKSDDEPEITMTLGSKYRILSLGSREEMLETRGTFRGVVSLGTVDAMGVELDEFHKDFKGKIRLIPSHMVLAIDILEAAPEKEKAKKEDSNLHYS